MSTPDPLRVAVIGSGPAGIYTAEALTRQSREPVAVDVLDRLPTPYGLVRYGVAPDHTSIKRVAHTLARVLEHPDVRFLGGVEYGTDLTRADLARAYHAVVYATGASVDRRMGIPGEDLSGSVAATDFVNWYSGHPDLEVTRFVLDAEEVAVVGAGNVALDVARILVRSVDELRQTDIPEPVLQVLAASKVRCVHIVARRGPLQAKFSANELRELGKLTDVDVTVDPAVVDLDPNSEEVATAARAARTNLRILRSGRNAPAVARDAGSNCTSGVNPSPWWATPESKDWRWSTPRSTLMGGWSAPDSEKSCRWAWWCGRWAMPAPPSPTCLSTRPPAPCRMRTAGWWTSSAPRCSANTWRAGSSAARPA